MFGNRKSLLTIFSVFAWLFLFGLGLSKHEYWRDEMRALSIAISAPSFSDFPFYLKNEGHPILWYAVLKLAYGWIHETWVLPALSFVFSFGIVVLIMFRSPFPMLIKVLLIFGVYCLYEYGINCRNYGIAAFFMMLFADIITRNSKQIFLAFLCLALATLSNVYAAMLVVFIAGYTLFDYKKNNGITSSLVLSVLLILVALAFSVFIMLPDANSLVVSKNVIDFISIKEVWLVGYGFDGFLNYRMHFSAYVLSLVLVGCLLLFLPNLKVLLCLLLALLSMSFFSLTIKGNLMHHQGMYFYTLVAFAWIQKDNISASLQKRNLISLGVLIGLGLNVFVLSIQVLKCYVKYEADYLLVKSESKAFGNWCNQKLKEGDLLIAEPDYILEGLMYYHNQAFYLPRENRIGTYAHFTKQNRSYLSLNQILLKADSLSYKYDIIYLVFDKKIEEKDSLYSYSYGKKFKVTSNSIQQFISQYMPIESFTNNFQNEENFFVYKKRK
ncbi:MAG: hypothetical protein PSX81_08840 [bacterium]|nr:hypothetical protein [bacterium]